MPAHQEFRGLGMQLLPPVTSKASTAQREQPSGKHLPYARHVDDHTIETRDGLLMQVIQVRGLLFETADSDEINHRKRLRDIALQAIGSSRYAVYHHIIRREAQVSLDADYQDGFARELDIAWKARLSGRKLYVNDLFLTVVRRPLQGKLGTIDRLRQRFGKVAGPLDTTRFELEQLNQARDALVASLGNYEPRVLGVYSTKQGHCSEVLELLAYLFNGEMRPVLLPMQDIGDYIPYRRISFGQDAIELGRAGASPRQFLALISV
jgi:type IV secretion system protein VirB4